MRVTNLLTVLRRMKGVSVLDQDREHREQAVKVILRKIRAVDDVDTARFLEAFVEAERPVPVSVARKLGLSWVQVSAGFKANPELAGHWEEVKEAKATDLVFEMESIMRDDEIEVSRAKMRIDTIVKMVKLLAPTVYGDAKGAVNIQVNVGDMVIEARSRVVQMKQRLAAGESVEDAGL